MSLEVVELSGAVVVVKAVRVDDEALVSEVAVFVVVVSDSTDNIAVLTVVSLSSTSVTLLSAALFTVAGSTTVSSVTVRAGSSFEDDDVVAIEPLTVSLCGIVLSFR